MRGEVGETVHSAPDMSIIEPFLPMLGMQAQLIGREAARLLLAATETFDRPVDSIVQMQWLHGARVLSARPIVIREIDRELGGTVLQKKKKGFIERLHRELHRPLMRSAIVRRNRRWRLQGQ
jgi:GR25 family glycosyltransferase involved in LPS biosynthesis